MTIEQAYELFDTLTNQHNRIYVVCTRVIRFFEGEHRLEAETLDIALKECEYYYKERCQ